MAFPPTAKSTGVQPAGVSSAVQAGGGGAPGGGGGGGAGQLSA